MTAQVGGAALFSRQGTRNARHIRSQDMILAASHYQSRLAARGSHLGEPS